MAHAAGSVYLDDGVSLISPVNKINIFFVKTEDNGAVIFFCHGISGAARNVPEEKL